MTEDEKFIAAFGDIARKVGALSVHIARAWACDHCKDESKEAHPYGVDDRDGKYWDVLCDDCYEQLGCAYASIPDYEDESCQECDGTGVIITCCDDLCVGGGYCIHGDGDEMCPACEGEGVVRKVVASD